MYKLPFPIHHINAQIWRHAYTIKVFVVAWDTFYYATDNILELFYANSLIN